MPIVRIDVDEERSDEQRQAISAAVHRAFVNSIGIPEGDRFHVVTSHPRTELIADPRFLGVDSGQSCSNEFGDLLDSGDGRHQGGRLGRVEQRHGGVRRGMPNSNAKARASVVLPEPGQPPTSTNALMRPACHRTAPLIRSSTGDPRVPTRLTKLLTEWVTPPPVPWLTVTERRFGRR